MKKVYTALLLILLAAMFSVGVYSLADYDATGSVSEKREFVKRNSPSNRCWTGRISPRWSSIIPTHSRAANRF